MKKETEQKESPLQLKYVEKLKKLMLDWTSQNGIKLHTIDCVIPFTLIDKSLIVWMFYETEQTKNDYENNGTNELVNIKYLELLNELNYPSNYLQEVTFQTDSDENVKKNYEGNFFYRLRL
jgi:hypothetical protein